MKRSIGLCAALVFVGVAMAGGPDPVAREGTGDRRARLNKMELQPFPADVWETLSQWQNGAAPTPEETDGKVVLICTWASWYPTSVKALPLAQRLSAQFADQGLLVVGVHDPKQWDAAAAAAATSGVTFRFAHDADGKFREKLLIDQDPDFYVIDRAGQLRYADIETGSVERAVAALVAETKEESGALPSNLAADASRRAEEAARSHGIRQNVDLAKIPDLPFPPPQPDAYARAKWPQRWTKWEQDVLGIQPPQPGQESVPVTLSLPPVTDKTVWFGPDPKVAGRAGVIYFYSPLPRHSASHSTIQPIMDRLQRAKGRDLTIVGVLTKYPSQSSGFGQNAEQEERDRLEFARLASRARLGRTYEHSQVIDADGALLTSIYGQYNQGNRTPPYFLTAIVSSDQTVRWMGDATDSRFDAALEQVLREDPAVKARRAVEEAWIKSRGG